MTQEHKRGSWRRQGERLAGVAGVLAILVLLGWLLLVNVRDRSQTRANATEQSLAQTAGIATVQAQSSAIAAEQATFAAQTATAQRAARQATAALRTTQTAAVQQAQAAATVAGLAQGATAAAEVTVIVAAQIATESAAQAATATAVALPTPTAAPTAAGLAAGALPVAPIPAGEVDQRRVAYSALAASWKLQRNETFDSAQTKLRWSENPNGGNAARRFKGSYQLTVAPGGAPNMDYWKEQRLGASYVVELDVSLPTPGTWAGIVFDAAPDGSTDRVFAVSDVGTWHLIARRGGQIDPAASSAAQASGAIGGGSQINTLRVVRSPDEIQVWANNTPLGVFAVGGAGGRVGVVGLPDARLGAPAIVHVDNFIVRTP